MKEHTMLLIKYGITLFVLTFMSLQVVKADENKSTLSERDVRIENVLWYKQPAEEWIEALPVGNGRLGAMVYGKVTNELLQLNEESLWAGPPVPEGRPTAILH